MTVMTITEEQVKAGTMMEGGVLRDYQIHVHITSDVYLSVVNMYELTKRWGLRYKTPDLPAWDGDSYEVGLCIASGDEKLRDYLIESIDESPYFEGSVVTTYYYLTIEEVNVLYAQAYEAMQKWTAYENE